MKKYIILTFILFIFLFNIDIVLFSVKDASLLFFNKVFISIFPFILLSDILIHYNYQIFIKNSFIGKFISKLFNIDYNCTTVFILSLLSSHPNNAVYIKNMIDNNLIDNKSISNLLTYTYFPSISFVIGTIGIILFNNIKIGIFLYIGCLINNISIGLYLRKNNNIFINNSINIENKNNFFNMLKNSITKSINTLYTILGNIIIFTIIINIFNHYININDTLQILISGILELTNGIINTSNLNIDLNNKIFIISFLLNFSGLSVLFQSFSILSEFKINIKKILIIKLIFSLLTSATLHIVSYLLL